MFKSIDFLRQILLFPLSLTFSHITIYFARNERIKLELNNKDNTLPVFLIFFAWLIFYS